MKLIAAVADNWGIGKDGKLLFSIPEDMKFFRKMTNGAAVVMGRRTLESLPGGRALKGRINIVLSRDPDYRAEGTVTVHSTEELLREVSGMDREIFVIGGGEVYFLLLPFCDKAYITKVEAARPADTFFPSLDADPAWKLESELGAGEHEGLCYRFLLYERTEKGGIQ